MKWLCILLLVANALFVGWQVNERLYGPLPQATAQEPPPLPPDAPPLTLLSEASEPPASREPAAEESNAEVTGTDAAPTETGSPPDGPVAPVEPSQRGEPVAGLAGPDRPAEPVEPPVEAAVAAASTPAAGVETGPVGAAPADQATPPPGEAVVSAADAKDKGATAAETPANEPAAPAPAVPAVPEKPVLLCATIGPFKTRDEQRAAERRLTPQVERMDGRSQTAREARMFTVFLEPAGTEAEAEKRLDELKSKGITDYFLIRRGEMRNAIQVGTFRSQESVTKRLAELERTGYKAVVVPKSETGAEKYWLDVVYDKERQSLRSLKSLAGEGARAIRADCPR